jgi:hypothetical protein
MPIGLALRDRLPVGYAKEQASARRGQPELAIAALEQGEVKPYLQLPDLLTDGAGCHAEPSRGTFDATGTADLYEDAQSQQWQWTRHGSNLA